MVLTSSWVSLPLHPSLSPRVFLLSIKLRRVEAHLLVCMVETDFLYRDSKPIQALFRQSNEGRRAQLYSKSILSEGALEYDKCCPHFHASSIPFQDSSGTRFLQISRHSPCPIAHPRRKFEKTTWSITNPVYISTMCLTYCFEVVQVRKNYFFKCFYMGSYLEFLRDTLCNIRMHRMTFSIRRLFTIFDIQYEHFLTL